MLQDVWQQPHAVEEIGLAAQLLLDHSVFIDGQTNSITSIIILYKFTIRISSCLFIYDLGSLIIVFIVFVCKKLHHRRPQTVEWIQEAAFEEQGQTHEKALRTLTAHCLGKKCKMKTTSAQRETRSRDKPGDKGETRPRDFFHAIQLALSHTLKIP